MRMDSSVISVMCPTYSRVQACRHTPMNKLQTTLKMFGLIGPDAHHVEVKSNFLRMHYRNRPVENNLKTYYFAFNPG